MTLTKKEKGMIFVLLLILLIGGFYVYGITPQKDKLEANNLTIKSLTTELDEAKTTSAQFSAGRYNNYQNSIEDIREQLDKMAAPGVDTTTEIQSGSLNENVEPHRVAIILRQYMAERGINTGTSIKISEKMISNGKVSYTYTTQYSCPSFTSIDSFIDDVARNTSYYITSMTFAQVTNENTDVTQFEGTIAITVTYLDI